MFSIEDITQRNFQRLGVTIIMTQVAFKLWSKVQVDQLITAYLRVITT